MARFILHETIINASVDEVWNELIAIEDWKWNRWTKLKADNPTEGVKGKLLASFEGDDTWKEYDFTFGRVSESEHLLTWVGGAGPKDCLFSGYHTMQLEEMDDSRTKLIHREKFGGILPAIGLGLPFKTLDRNYLLMNEALKHHVECK
mmetsp:Transcript_6566/g.13839  ORF Transcript_6566/g.13839 Transcript_6566/m.13839 type:complete len:148 (-) Transcript_6566:135-578(-)|eukprot:CAMPEP_0113421692 /NCGR_PEP_ID=MMETSP0013_2-20120614/28040_1 /TAXON_ID=2843 ORGANISM="Skeletonema costatum, Strain 1716" /NCGR_SAMPLE_ID=MMETSP0013_2 /ASSEMBLY_ACC=CAM_ASM_000158 /LENGTH=147 /DNA_ID=CAMNT_0000309341 /DNA_START=27 /DNA_END=470 /DNA_ORIENTATION=+ /assembly_acc=CAM_ASM_000158